MSDERKKPPPREPFRVLTGDDAPIPMAPRPPRAITERLEELIEGHKQIVATQRRMAQQLDGFGATINQRFNIFHEELAMLRQLVTADHAPRIDKVEKTLGAKAAKGGGIVAIILLVGPMLAEALPKYRAIIEQVVGLFQ